MARVTYTEPQVGSPKTAASVNAVTGAAALQSSNIDVDNHKVEAYDSTSFDQDAFSQVYQGGGLGAGLFFREIVNLSAPDSTSGDWNATGTDEPLIGLSFNPALPLGANEVLRLRFFCEVATNGNHLGGIIGPNTAEVRLKLVDGFNIDFEISGTRRWVGYTNAKASGQRGSGCLATSCLIKSFPFPRGIRSVFPVFTFSPPVSFPGADFPTVEFHNCWFDAVKFVATDTSNIEMTLVP